MSKYTGIDISKDTIDCSITLADGKIATTKFSNNVQGFEKLRKLLHEESHVVMEASGPYYTRLAYYLFAEKMPVSVVNPLVIKRFCQMRMVRTKTDRKDAGMIREYAQTEHPEQWVPDEINIVKLKQLNTVIELMEKSITATRNQLMALKEMPDSDPGLIATLTDHLKQTEQTKKKLEKEMTTTAVEHYNATYKALQTIPGIGPKSAAMLIAITSNFKKFSHYRQLIAYVGLNPRIYESGTSVKGKGHICKMGTGRIRKLFYLCSWSAKKVNPQCAEMYQRLKARSKPERVIKVAIANKLLRQAFAIGKNGTCFKINYQPAVAN